MNVQQNSKAALIQQLKSFNTIEILKKAVSNYRVASEPRQQTLPQEEQLLFAPTREELERRAMEYEQRGNSEIDWTRKVGVELPPELPNSSIENPKVQEMLMNRLAQNQQFYEATEDFEDMLEDFVSQIRDPQNPMSVETLIKELPFIMSARKDTRGKKRKKGK